MTDTSALHRFDPLALDAVPEVDALLERLGLGAFDGADLTAHIGRNDNWAGTTRGGARVFVKRVGDGSGEDLRRFRRIVTFDLLATRPELADVRGPRLLGYDIASRLVVFELLTGVSSGAELAAEDDFGEDLCHQAGRIVGALHACRPELSPVNMDGSPPPLPVVSTLDAVPLPMFQALSAAEVELWGILQSDTAMADALRDLRRAEDAAPRRLCHCDLRLDQFLVGDGLLHLTDWEEFRLGDPARDIGGFAGEWLYRAILGIPGAAEDGGELTHAEVLARGVRELDRLRPNILAFWRAYREACPEIDDGLATRAVRFAGWHMIDRGLARAAQNARLGAVDRAAAGIGRNALLEPERFVTTLGLGETL
ncbi:Phosphotransferase enzyme family protein [Microbispora rosea]|uniref:Phosphotransferase enzyme family protein n=1 Tax=Microbispora rosea TaxID=58117 RepID=A0A1N7CLF2_9ACTN|nr:class V lanthionine synthetase subunit LxmK [Microbispora rosea]GIH46362.1 hypothetical protein Mro03_15410 [Microbispora rosea subsp. rosea]SIR64400.1 Phosphotransferase enzyme family protein [Microbispora rosea]